MFLLAQRLMPKYERNSDGVFGAVPTTGSTGKAPPSNFSVTQLADRSPALVAATALVASDVVSIVGLATLLHWAARWAAGTWIPAAEPMPGAAQFEVNRSLFLLAILASLGVLAYCGYRRHYTQRPPAMRQAKDIFAASSWSFAAVLAVWLATGSRWDIFVPVLVALIPFAVCWSRDLTRQLLQAAGLWQIPVVLVGAETDVRRAWDVIDQDGKPGYRVVELVVPAAGADASTASETAAWRHAVAKHGVHDGVWRGAQIVVASGLHPRMEQLVVTWLLRQRLPFAVFSESDVPSMLADGQAVPLGQADASLLFYDRSRPVSRAMKTLIDVTLAAIILVAILPALIGIALLVRLDGGPILYAHERVGARGRRFKCLKFRSMAVNSDELLRDLLARDPRAAAEWATTRKLNDDPRVTKVGHILRKTSLDELPQLLNVLRREMSLVGPRPIVEQEIPRYADDIAYYYESRPGITGLWQVSGRSNTSYERRVHLDCCYAKNWTLWDDLVILAWTVPAVLGRKGAR